MKISIVVVVVVMTRVEFGRGSSSASRRQGKRARGRCSADAAEEKTNSCSRGPGRPDGVEYVSVDDTKLSDDGKELHEAGLTEESAEWEGKSYPDQGSDA